MLTCGFRHCVRCLTVVLELPVGHRTVQHRGRSDRRNPHWLIWTGPNPPPPPYRDVNLMMEAHNHVSLWRYLASSIRRNWVFFYGWYFTAVQHVDVLMHWCGSIYIIFFLFFVRKKRTDETRFPLLPFYSQLLVRFVKIQIYNREKNNSCRQNLVPN